jgi:peptidoglycan/xylan/chitin deacetylase (PgdA/CDA1 family)
VQRRASLPALVAALAVSLATGCGSSAGPETQTTVAGAAGQIANGPIGAAVAPPVHVPPSHAVVPVLMYHVIAPAPHGATYAGLWVAPADLQAQVRALAAAGFTGVTLDTVLDAWRGRARLPPHPVVLSFDDGYLSQGREAGAILRAAGWPGVLNLALHNLDAPGGLTAGRVRAMIADGWEIDAHSLTHPDLTRLDAAGLVHEIAGSRAEIQHRFGVPADAFCYPAGRWDPTVARAVRAAGYRAATTERPGAARPADDRYALPRIRVDAGESAQTLVHQVRAALGSAA